MLQPNLTRYRDSLSKLISTGDEMELDLVFRASEEEGNRKKEHQEAKKKVYGSFEKNYQRWYTEAYAVLKQLLPERLGEFVAYYKPDPRRKNITVTGYVIQDWLSGIRVGADAYGKKPFSDLAATLARYRVQLDILKSIEVRFESSLFEIRQLVQADLFDSEVEVSRELLRAGFLRGAGAVAGVVLEKHLSQVCVNHDISINKKHPTIADLIDPIKNADVIDVPAWRQIQRLGDLRNLASHNKQREPRAAEMEELIDGVDKITKTLY
jgi:hypothetical protein